MNGKLLSTAAFILYLTSGSALASAPLITITGGTFSDGGTFSGQFSEDDPIPLYWNITTSGGTTNALDQGNTYYPNKGVLFTTESSEPSPNSFLFSFSSDTAALELNLTITPTSAGAGTLSGAEDYYYNCSGPCDTRSVTGGAVSGLPTGVPEPTTWAMLVVGAALAGAALRQHRQVIN